MLKKTLLLTFVLLAALGVGIYFSYTSLKGIPLFDNRNAQWGILASVVVGLILGVARGLLKKKNEIKGDLVTRHGLGSLISHWGTAFGIFAAMYSGVMLGFFVMSGKSIWFLPVFAKTQGAVISALDTHYFAVLMTLFGGFFFGGDYLSSRNPSLLFPNLRDITQGFIGKYFLRRKWDFDDKYLSSQKGAFVPYAAIGIVMVLSGAVKVAAHVWPITANIWGWATVIHDVFTVFIILFTVVHVAIVVLLNEWPAFRSWWTGTMTTKHVEAHHHVWYEDLTTRTNKV
jgi:cytochrome b subunit of formate dehydrogenase